MLPTYYQAASAPRKTCTCYWCTADEFSSRLFLAIEFGWIFRGISLARKACIYEDYYFAALVVFVCVSYFALKHFHAAYLRLSENQGNAREKYLLKSVIRAILIVILLGLLYQASRVRPFGLSVLFIAISSALCALTYYELFNNDEDTKRRKSTKPKQGISTRDNYQSQAYDVESIAGSIV